MKTSDSNNMACSFRKKAFKFSPVYLAIVTSTLPFDVFSAIIPDDNSGNLNVNQSANGTATINIVDPNANGVSHNKYQEFNVDQNGVIFNNSKDDGVSQIGGHVIKNNNLNNEANVIINEVGGVKGTQLNGTMEVFGKSADLIIANENGIQVNGVKTLNANNLTLSTGRVEQENGQFLLNVTKGQVQISGNGISTDGLSHFDIVSRAIQLDGQIAGSADVKLLAGANKYNTSTRQHQTKDGLDDSRPLVSIAGSELGSIYGNRIELISTDSGVGVHHHGSIVSQSSLDISANGDLKLTSLQSKNDSVSLKGDNISLGGNKNEVAAVLAKKDINIEANNHLLLSSDLISENGSVAIFADSFLQQAAGIFVNESKNSAQVDSIIINVKGDYNIKGSLYATNSNGDVIPDAKIVLHDGNYVVYDSSGNIVSDAIVASSATVMTNSGNIKINSGTLNNENGVLISKENSIVFNIKDLFHNDGAISASGDIHITSNELNNKGVIGSQKNINVNLSSFVNSGSITGDSLNLDAGTVKNDGRIVSSNGGVTIKAKGNIDNSGLIQGSHVHIKQDSGRLTNSGELLSDNDISIDSQLIDNKKTIAAKNNVVLSSVNSLNNDGEIIAGNDFLLSGKGQTQIDNNGLLQGENVQLEGLESINNKGSVLANKELKIKDTQKLKNDGEQAVIQGGNIDLNNIQTIDNANNAKVISKDKLSVTNSETLTNSGSIHSNNELVISNVNTINNNSGFIISSGSMSIDNVNSLSNTGANNKASGIYSDGDLTIESVNEIKNSSKAQIKSENGKVSFKNIDSLDNETNSLISSNNDMIFDEVKNITNKGEISSESNIFFTNVNKLLNQGGVIFSDDNIFFQKVNEILNELGGYIRASNNIKAEDVIYLKNEDSFIDAEGNIYLNVNRFDNVSTYDRSLVLADGKLEINADVIKNENSVLYAAGNVNLTASEKLINNNDGRIESDESIFISADSISNNNSKIDSNDKVNINVYKSIDNNGGTIVATNEIYFKINNDYVYNENSGSFAVRNKKDGLLTLESNSSITIDEVLESPAAIQLIATGSITNNKGILSGNNILLKSDGDITNSSGALIFSSKDINIVTDNGTFSNREKANVMAMHDINITAYNVKNIGGQIRSENDINIEAKNLENITTIDEDNSGWDYTNSQIINSQHTQKGSGFTANDYFKLSGAIPLPIGHIEIQDKASISAKNEVNINKGNKYQGGQQVLNQGGQIQSGGDMFIRGDLTNKAISIDIGYEHILNKPLNPPLTLKYNWKNKLGASGGHKEMEFYTLYDFIDFILDPNTDEGYLKVTKNVDVSNGQINILDKHMNQLFGNTWKAKSKGDLQKDWDELNKIDSDTGEKNFHNLKFYAVSEQNSSIAAGGNLTHKDGSFNNGLDKELALDKKGNEHVVTEKVDDKEIHSNNSSYEVTTSKNDLAWLDSPSGITTSGTYEDMINMPGLFAPNHNILGGTANLQPNPDPKDNIYVLYETRPEFIDQDAFYGSDYFFQQVGYEPNEPVIVLGDNYFISEVIRREIDDSVGTFFLTRDGLEGADLTKQLMENAGDVNGSEDFVVGQPLTEEQVKNLDKDIIWFVTEEVDGVQVLVPRIYLAPSTIEQINNDSNNASASVSAGGNIDINATEVNNVNGTIKSGGNIDIQAESNIVNSSVGQNGGIQAGGDLSLVSEKGDIHNSGAALNAGNDLKLDAKEGDVTLTASTGYDDAGKKVVHRYDDGVSAGGNIDISGNNVNVNAVDIESDKDISITAKDGDVNFNNIYETDSTYDSEYSTSGLFTTNGKETTTSSATSVESSVKAGGNLNINSSNDVVMKGGEYSGTAGTITAGGNVDLQATQDYTHSEVVESSSGFVLSAGANGFGQSVNHDSYSGGNKETVSEKGAHDNKESEISNAGSVRPGAAPTTETGGFKVGVKTETTTTTENSVKNNNASLNFSNDLTIQADKTVDIGGADLSGDTIKIDADELKSTKYEDVTSKTVTHEETFVGIKGEAHSDWADGIDKAANKIEQTSSDQQTDGLLTGLELAGAGSNMYFGDAAGGSVSVGWDHTSETTNSTTSSENISTIKGNNIEINTKNNAELNGVDIQGNNIDMAIGGDLAINSAKNGYTESSSSQSHSAGVSLGASAGMTGAGVGVSVDYSGSQQSSVESGTSHTNSQIVGDNVNIKTGGDMSLTGANIKSDSADIDVGGDLNITSVQDTVNRGDNNQQWGASVGAAISSSGVIPTFSGSYGEGYENYESKTTAEQSGINTTGELNIKTGNDLNITGGHVISQSGEGTVNVSGDINANTLHDTVNQEGLSAGGGGGLTLKGNPTVNGYANTSDKIDYQEDQNATISVGNTVSQNVNGDLNTDKNNLSEVKKDIVVAGNDISFTLGKPGSSKKPSDSATGKQPTPEKKPTPRKKPTPEIKPTPENKPMPGKKPTPENKPMPEKKPTPEKQPTPDKKPTPEKQPTPDKKPTPEKQPTPDKKPIPDKQPTPEKPVTKWPEVKPSKPVVTSPGGSSSLPGFVPPRGNNPGSNGTNAPSKGNNGNGGATKWPEVKPVKPVVTSPGGSSSLPGFVPPRGNSHGSNGSNSPSKGNNGNGGVTKWPEVKPAKPVVTSPGSSSSLPGFVPPRGDSQGINGVSVPSKGDNANSGATKWPEVKPAKPVTTTPGSSNSLSGFVPPNVDKTTSIEKKKWLQLLDETIIS
ncbi:hemagglutinin repeat-containing protein [Klebsiella sp. BIGb0407]|uniref:two-partner secretion domain-containing protein n=1 Tax=Klebsiella sp. BIGb0407 TaxID=2940603 RepID=UPI00216971B0|nr:hemagglutinin repeat-containing protein [Klebsiella sp. BIGb0407]MCS3433164.1 filamentous hemagglutinin [Klebsiella sp. BIGb0407]